jgi:hypothetical protein
MASLSHLRVLPSLAGINDTSFDTKGEGDPGGNAPGNSGKSISSVDSKGGVVKGILRNKNGRRNKEKVASPTIQDPWHHCSHQEYQHGPGMMPRKTSNVLCRSQMDDSSNSSGSSCATLICAEPCEVAKLVRRAVDSLFGDTSNNVESDKRSSTHATTSPEGHAQLLEKFEKLQKFVTEKNACGEAIKGTRDLNPHETNESAIAEHAGNELIGGDLFRKNSASVEDNAHRSLSTHAILSTPQDYAELLEKMDKLCKLVAEKEASGESEKKSTNMISLEASTSLDLLREYQFVEMEAVSKDSNSILVEVGSRSRERLMTFTPLKSSQAREGTATSPQEPVIHSMGFPLASSCEKLSGAMSWESDFSSTNLFAGENNARGFSSPVSVTFSLGTQSCAWCGLGGSNAKAAKKLMVCSACQSTYYCSSECQSKDWINGHAMMCQLVTIAD